MLSREKSPLQPLSSGDHSKDSAPPQLVSLEAVRLLAHRHSLFCFSFLRLLRLLQRLPTFEYNLG